MLSYCLNNAILAHLLPNIESEVVATVPLLPNEVEEICEKFEINKAWCSHCTQPQKNSHARGITVEDGIVLLAPTRPRLGSAYMWCPERDNLPPPSAGFVHITHPWVDADIHVLLGYCPQLYMVEMSESQEYLLSLWIDRFYRDGIGAQVFNRYRNGLSKP